MATLEQLRNRHRAPRPREPDRGARGLRPARQGRVRGHRRPRPRLPGLGLRRHRLPRHGVGQRAGLDDAHDGLAVRARGHGLRGLRDLAGDGPLRRHHPRQRRREAGVQDGLVDRDDVQRRHGHRADVLRRQRAALPLRHAAARHRSRSNAGEAVQTRWPPRCSTGPCTRGRSTPWSGSPSPTAPSARAARS